MNREQILELKASITAELEIINKHKEVMEATLEQLSRLDKEIYNGVDISSSDENKQIRHIRFRRDKKSQKDSTTIASRIKCALHKIEGNFNRNQLLEIANKDGNAHPIPPGSFAPVFSELLKEKQVILVKENKGNKANVYRKANDRMLQTEVSPVEQL